MSEETTEKEATPKQADFLAKVRKQFEDDCSDEKDIREQALLDLRFEAGDQWESSVKTERTAKGRPALTFNRCHTFVQQVSNEARQNKVQVKFVVGDGGDKDTAEVKEGLARHIQYESDAQIAYETAVEYSAGGSFGFIGLITEYCDDESWDQDLKVRAFFDPFSVYGVLIPTCFGLEPQHAFVVEDVPTEDYKRLYDTEEIDNVGWDQAAKLSQGWIGTDTVRVAEYWWIEYAKKTIKRINPDTREEEEREVSVPAVKSCKLNGYQILPDTETEWVGDCIPIWAVLGKQRIISGKPVIFSVIRFQRDPQQLINFYKTRIAETLGTQPIQPYVIAEGQIQGHEREWAELNMTMRPYLTYKSEDAGGKQVPPPQRQVLEAPIQAFSAAAQQEIDDMKATTGIYDASLGAKSNESSGIALQRRQQQANITNMHFLDNLERTAKKLGLATAKAIPKVYDAKRAVQILGQDETPKIAKINWQHFDEKGQERHYKVKESSDDVPVVTMGRAFSSKRMESFDMMTSVLQTSPNLLPMIGDIFFRNSDLAGADQLAERFKKMLPPQLQDQDEGDPATQVQALQAKLQQMDQNHKALNAYAQKLEKEKEGRVIENQFKSQIAQMQEQSRQEIVRMQEATKLAVAQINASKDANQAFAEQEISQYKIMHDAAHDVALQSADQAHAKEMADTQHQQALEQQTQAGAQQAALQQQAQQVNGQ